MLLEHYGMKFEAQHSLYVQPGWQLTSFICCVSGKASPTYLLSQTIFFSVPHPFETECVEPHQSILTPLPFIVFTKAALEAVSRCSRRAASACKSLASSLLRLPY